MFGPIARLLQWFYGFTGSFALSIALLTLAVMILVTPLTLKGTRSMIQMQRLQPEIKRIQNEFKGDRQRLNEELMKFYQANKINPVGGCLPMLIQAPVFGVLYRVVHKLTENCSQVQIDKATASVGRRCFAPGTIKPGTFGPSYIDQASDLWRALAGKTQMLSFGIDLSHSTVKQLGVSFGDAIPFMILILLVGVTSWYQQHQIMRRTKGQPSAMPAQQQMIMKFLPFMWPIFLLTLPTGLAVYALTSNLYRIAQQGFITRTMYHKTDEGTFAPRHGNKEIITTLSTEVPKAPVIPPKAKNRPLPSGRPGDTKPSSPKIPDPKNSGGKSPGEKNKNAKDSGSPVTPPKHRGGRGAAKDQSGGAERDSKPERPSPSGSMPKRAVPKPKPGSGRDKG
jgi:YidC/Oxa1 family membrane protein insertase